MDCTEDTNLSRNDEDLCTDIATSSLNISLDTDYFFDKPPNCEDSSSLIADLVLTHLKDTGDGTIGSDVSICSTFTELLYLQASLQTLLTGSCINNFAKTYYILYYNFLNLNFRIIFVSFLNS